MRGADIGTAELQGGFRRQGWPVLGQKMLRFVANIQLENQIKTDKLILNYK
jgi:hypothetical protein